MRLIPRLHSSAVIVRHSGAISRLAAAAASPASKAASQSASSAAAAGGFLAALVGWAALFGLLVVMPIAMLANGAEPAAVLGWMAMVIVAMAVSWFLEGRRQRQWLKRYGRPKRENYPASVAFRAEHGTAESSAKAEKTAPETAWMCFAKWAARWGAGKAEAAPASPAEPVPCFVAFEGHDPRILETRCYTVVDAVMDAHAEAEAAGLSRADTVEHLANVLRGAKPYSGSKAGKQPAGRGGAGSGQWGGRGRLEQGAQVIEAKAGRAWLPFR